jgi:hypothetical protein
MDTVSHRKLWYLLGASLFAAFFILGFFGREVYRQAPPIPSRVVASDAATIFTRDDILTGNRFGNQPAGSSWDRSGDTARIRRPTGRPTGCIAKRQDCSTSEPGAKLASPTIC